MPENAGGFPEVDRLIHEPARLALLTVLSACESADFTFLQRVTGLSNGNLSVQLTKLEQAGLVYIEKTIYQKKTLTTAELSRQGRDQLSEYWRVMRRIQEQSAPRPE